MFKLAMGLAGGGLLLVAGGATLAGNAGQPIAPAQVPLTHGFYAQEQWQCSQAPNLFRFDGSRMGWLFADGGDNFTVPAELELQPDWRYRAYIQDIDIDPAVHPEARFEFHFRPVGQSRVAITIHEERMYRLCQQGELPEWARRR